MEFVLGLISLLVTAISIVVTIWAMLQKEETNKRIPQIVANEMKKVLNAAPAASDVYPQRRHQEEAPSQEIEARELRVEIGPFSLPHVVTYADVDGDGDNELLIQYPTGLHGSTLKIFGWRDGEFAEVDSLWSDCPLAFRVEDVDLDGQIEIVGMYTDYSYDLPYSAGLKLALIYKWDGNTFVAVDTRKLYDKEYLEARLKEKDRAASFEFSY